MPKDNLLNSACLDFFEFIKRESVKPLIIHLGEVHRERLEKITYVDTFQTLILKYDQMQAGYNGPDASFDSEATEAVPNSRVVINGASRWSQGLKDPDLDEEAYYNTSDNEDEDSLPTGPDGKPVASGASPVRPVVNYPDDDEDNAMDIVAESGNTAPHGPGESNTSPLQPLRSNSPALPSTPTVPSTPPERISEKRRRADEDDEDELGKLSMQSKRRNSVSSTGSNTNAAGGGTSGANSSRGPLLRRKGSINSGKDGPPKKIAISLAVKGAGGNANNNKNDGNGSSE